MDHADHVRLLRAGVTPGGVWADLGAGTGAFTRALAELLGAGGEVIAVDRDRGALRDLARRVQTDGGASVRPLVGDFTRPLALLRLDGVVMANSLHFVDSKLPVLDLIRGYLRRGGDSCSSSTTPTMGIPGHHIRCRSRRGATLPAKRTSSTRDVSRRCPAASSVGSIPL